MKDNRKGSDRKTRVAVIGIHGIPARYGGFESLVENIVGENCSDDIEYTVFCSGRGVPRPRLSEYKGCRLRYIDLKANGPQSVPFDMTGMLRCLRGYDTLLVLGVSGCLMLPLFRLLSPKTRIVVNIDGMEHRRDKWGWAARELLRTSEEIAVRHADHIIADNKGIQKYVTDIYGRPSEVIAYGGDQVIRDVPTQRQQEILDGYGLRRGEYGITVCRIEPENNCHTVLEAADRAGKPIVFIGNWDHSDYSRRLKEKYEGHPYVKTAEAVYDLDILYALRANAGVYLHGHSAGGTNVSLVEAMFFGIPILAYDVIYNRYTTGERAYYWKDADELTELLGRSGLDGSPMREMAMRRYTWAEIARRYEALIRR